MVALRGTDIVNVPIKDAVAKLKRVDPFGQEVQEALAVGTSFATDFDNLKKEENKDDK